MNRALRRHHARRIKNKRKDHWFTGEKTPAQLGVLAKTPAICSCIRCGNPRRQQVGSQRSRKTLQEYRNELSYKEGMAQTYACRQVYFIMDPLPDMGWLFGYDKSYASVGPAWRNPLWKAA